MFSKWKHSLSNRTSREEKFAMYNFATVWSVELPDDNKNNNLVYLYIQSFIFHVHFLLIISKYTDSKKYFRTFANGFFGTLCLNMANFYRKYCCLILITNEPNFGEFEKTVSILKTVTASSKMHPSQNFQ